MGREGAGGGLAVWRTHTYLYKYLYAVRQSKKHLGGGTHSQIKKKNIFQLLLFACRFAPIAVLFARPGAPHTHSLSHEKQLRSE